MGRDKERLKEFLEQEGELNSAMELLEVARASLEETEDYAGPQYQNRINGLRGQIGDLMTEMNNEKPGYTMKKAGAKHQERTGPEDSYSQE